MLRKKKEIEEELKPKQIRFIEFESYKELIPFLESLFKLKPQLITSFSQDKFRIVIENYTGTITKTREKSRANGGGPTSLAVGPGGYAKVSQADYETSYAHGGPGKRFGSEKTNSNAGTLSEYNLQQTEYVIDYLRELGCKVPVLLYSDMQGEYED